jgi:hypothetical protein
VRENFIYTGKFRLPRGTPYIEIEDLADETLANLGLSRVADSLVGDVRRRGVSGGEKKRVNIGLELMARPSCLFLDEPTSGLVRRVHWDCPCAFLRDISDSLFPFLTGCEFGSPSYEFNETSGECTRCHYCECDPSASQVHFRLV